MPVTERDRVAFGDNSVASKGRDELPMVHPADLDEHAFPLRLGGGYRWGL